MATEKLPADPKKEQRIKEIEGVIIYAIARYTEILPTVHGDEIDTALSHILYERMIVRKS